MNHIKTIRATLAILTILVMFSLGWASSIAFAKINPSVPDTVYVIGTNEFHSIEELNPTEDMDTSYPITMTLLGGSAQDVPSPNDWIKESQINVYNDRVIIKIDGAEWSEFTDTNSMDPVIDKGANAIEVIPKSPDQITVGDIIAYESQFAPGTIIHRVVETGTDSDGWYCFVKGDNLPTQDPGKIRFNQVKRVVVAVLY